MEAFLREVEARAYRLTLMQVRDADDALDIVQEAMIKLVRRYAKRPAADWPPLFYRILQNKTRDWHRRQAVRRRVLGFFTRGDDGGDDVIEEVAASPNAEPSGQLERHDAMAALERALRELPTRQREAFMLRNFEGLDVAETATAMGCTQGSVKTHYSRAVHRLKERLGEHWS
jgi:RNA polymerase sigma-70 factor, ECF subfamily